MTKLFFGPVLSFRGCTEDEWKVSALIAVDSRASVPQILLDGKPTPPPRILLEHGGRTYFRYDLSYPQQEQEVCVPYTVVGVGETWHFTIPAKNTAPRVTYVSCNGLSDPNGLRKLIKAKNSVWTDLLSNHDKRLRPTNYQLDKEQLWHESRIHDKGIQRFHLLIMGGDQLYLDSMWEDIKLMKKWIGMSRQDQLKYRVPEKLDKEIESYYIHHYCESWLSKDRNPWGAKTKTLDSAYGMANIPTIMMWDDHDIFDGWGSYSKEMQQSPMFQRLFYHARRAFWVFQMQQCIEDLPELTRQNNPYIRSDDPLFEPITWSNQLKHDNLALPLFDGQASFSFAYQIGPLQIVVPDLRTERSVNQVLGPNTWSALHRWFGQIQDNGSCRHLLFISSVPVVHPKLSLAEAFLDNLGSDHVLDSSADDLKDHWAHDNHEGERKRLAETLLRLAKEKKVKVTFVSGDVHVAAWGVLYKQDVAPKENWAQIHQLTSTAIVHPSLVSIMERLFLNVLNTVAKKKQALDVNLFAEMMLFPNANRYVMATRNWLAIELDNAPNNTKLWATWRCESQDGFSNHLLAIDSISCS
ncbi:hypothetical protein [Glaesserella sp.]|uniref:hypothetical protein n=1 Tax=Glaesserella sp. TaxID=2094731 RepID=UPI0035A150B9